MQRKERRLQHRLQQLAHLGRVARHLEAALFHDGELGIGGVGAARDQRAGMEECGFKVTRNPSEMGRLLKAML